MQGLRLQIQGGELRLAFSNEAFRIVFIDLLKPHDGRMACFLSSTLWLLIDTSLCMPVQVTEGMRG